MMTKPFERAALFTGDRDWSDRLFVVKVIGEMPSSTVIIVGGAKGLDTFAEQEAKRLGMPVARMDANWDFYHKAAGPIRNSWMLQVLLLFKVRVVHAFHNDLEHSKGTKDMVTRAEKANVPVVKHTSTL